MANELVRALDLDKKSKLEDVLTGFVEGGASLLGGAVYTGMGSPSIKGVPVDLAAAGILYLMPSPTGRAIARGVTYGALGRFGAEFGKSVNLAWQSNK